MQMYKLRTRRQQIRKKLMVIRRGNLCVVGLHTHTHHMCSFTIPIRLLLTMECSYVFTTLERKDTTKSSGKGGIAGGGGEVFSRLSPRATQK